MQPGHQVCWRGQRKGSTLACLSYTLRVMMIRIHSCGPHLFTVAPPGLLAHRPASEEMQRSTCPNCLSGGPNPHNDHQQKALSPHLACDAVPHPFLPRSSSRRAVLCRAASKPGPSMDQMMTQMAASMMDKLKDLTAAEAQVKAQQEAQAELETKARAAQEALQGELSSAMGQREALEGEKRQLEEQVRRRGAICVCVFGGGGMCGCAFCVGAGWCWSRRRGSWRSRWGPAAGSVCGGRGGKGGRGCGGRGEGT